jgi:hypothetical protein
MQAKESNDTAKKLQEMRQINIKTNGKDVPFFEKVAKTI